MVNNFWIDIRGEAIGGRNDDLAKGSGGDYRYFQWSNDMSVDR
jgi:hypothetical protein